MDEVSALRARDPRMPILRAAAQTGRSSGLWECVRAAREFGRPSLLAWVHALLYAPYPAVKRVRSTLRRRGA